MLKIKPCPFCGELPNVYQINGEDYVECLNPSCPISIDNGGEAFTESSWNRRPEDKAKQIYNGTYLDVEISVVVKNKPTYNENANSLLRSAWMIANRNGEQTNWEAFRNAVYKELVAEHAIKTSSEFEEGKVKELRKEDSFYVFPILSKEFCPNCEAETVCTHVAELFACKVCGEDFAKYI